MVASGTFSAQLEAQKQQQQQGRTTRTQKLIQTRQIANYNQLVTEAERIKQERFSNITTVEEYYSAYNSLPDNLKQFFKNPDDVKVEMEVDPEYQKYITEKKKYEEAVKEQQAYEWAKKTFEKGHAGETLYFAGKDLNEYERKWLKYFLHEQQAGNIYPIFTELGQEKYKQSREALQKLKDISKELGIKFQGSYLTTKAVNEKLKTIDTTLKLGTQETPPTVMVAGVTTMTSDQIALNEFYETKSILEKGTGFIKNTWENLFGKNEATAPKLETTKTITAPQGTATTTIGFTPQTQTYLDEVLKFEVKANTLANSIFQDYEKKISKMEVPTQEKIDILKIEEQAKFNLGIGVYSKQFQENYTANMEKIERGKVGMLEVTPLGLIITPIKKYRYKLQDEQKNLQGTANIPKQSEIETQALKDFSFYRSRGYSKELSKNLASDIEFSKGIYYGVKTAFVEHPKTIMLDTALWTGAIAGATIISTYTGGLGGIATSPIIKWAGLGLMGLYGGSVVVRTATPKTSYARGIALGTIGAEEILPMFAGGVAGTYIGLKTVEGIDLAYYKYYKKLPYRASYKLTEMEQLTGEKRFTTISPSNREAQLKAFKKLDKGYLTPDEKALLRKGIKLDVTTHATSNRVGFIEDEVLIEAKGREINAMSVANKRFSKNFWDIGKKPSYSLYSGQLVPTGSAPLGLRIEVKGFGKIPKGYNPQLTMAELSKILGAEINPKYFKMTSYLYEKGVFGKGYVAGLKAEVEAYLKGFGTLKRTPKPEYYTQVANEDFYKKLEAITRLGNKEYVFRVKKFSILKPSTWIDKILGREAGRFKPMTRGRVVPISRWEALSTGDKSLMEKIRASEIKGIEDDISIINKRYEQILKGKKFELPSQHGAEHLTRVRRNILKLLDVYPEFHTELINQYGSLTKAKMELGRSAILHDLARGLRGSHAQRMAQILRSGKFKFGTPSERIIKAIEMHDITFGASTVEGKLLSTADRLDLTRFGTAINPNLLPLQDALGRLKINVIEKKAVSLSSAGFIPKISASYPSSYAYSLLSLSRTRKVTSPSLSASRSYALRSAISSVVSSPSASRVSRAVSSRISLPSYSYLTSISTSKSSSQKSTKYSVPRLPSSDYLKNLLRTKTKPTPQFKALIPDFTARALGLAPKKVKSVKEAMREINKLQSGFEIRTGATFSNPLKNKIKSKRISEKELMKGVMKW